MGYELIGVSIAYTITASLQLITIHFYLLCHPIFKETQIWPNKETLNGIRNYLQIGLFGAAMLCAEWWIFEFLIFLSGLLAVENTAT